MNPGFNILMIQYRKHFQKGSILNLWHEMFFYEILKIENIIFKEFKKNCLQNNFNFINF